MSKRLSGLFGIVCGLALVASMVAGCAQRAKEHPSTMEYHLPTTLAVDLGQTLPGSDIVYERWSEEGAVVRIHGQEALKKTGDSLNWSGEPMAGVKLDLKLRVAVYNEDALHLVGTADIDLEGVSPRVSAISTDSTLKFAGPVAYSVAKGAVIPGTTLTYEGKTDEGAQLGGLDEYPYRQGGDSIFWEGKLTDQVNIRVELRVVQYDEGGLRTAGLVTLWLGN